jgi:hypothetical protein
MEVLNRASSLRRSAGSAAEGGPDDLGLGELEESDLLGVGGDVGLAAEDPVGEVDSDEGRSGSWSLIGHVSLS